MRVRANNAYASVMYQGYAANKRVPSFSPQDSLYQESLKDESKQLKNVYHDFSEFNPMNFLGTAYIRSKILDSSQSSQSSQSQENSINLTPGVSINLGKYSGSNLYLKVGDSSCDLSWGSTSIGDEYNKQITDTINHMIGGAVDANGFPDMTKLTREQNEIITKMEKDHQRAVMQLGGPEEYDYLSRISDAIDHLIRIANGQMPMVSLSPDMHGKIKAGLEMVGIDTSKPFYVNGQKFTFTEGGALRYSE